MQVVFVVPHICMKFKTECWMLHLGRSYLVYKYRLGDERLESSHAERELWGSCQWQDALSAKRANCILGCSRTSIASWAREAIVPFYSVLVQPHLKYRLPQYKDIK